MPARIKRPGAARKPGGAFEAFLSHRYKSPEINQYFFDLFEPIAQVQFSVDSGEYPINVTRLERKIRAVDAFVGIYPFPVNSNDDAQPRREELLTASRYFRLELDLATRSGCPAIVFVDDAYGPTLPIPESMMICPFDSREILGGGRSPNAPRFQRTFRNFFAMVASAMESRHVFDRRAPTPNLAGLLLPPGSDRGYTETQRALIRDLLKKRNFETTDIDWNARLDAKTLADLHTLDLVVTDVGDAMPGQALVAFLHGRFVPMVRLRRLPKKGKAGNALARLLFGGLDVGYVEDIVDWSTTNALSRQFDFRLHTLTRTSRRLSTSSQARDYFLGAARRKEGVFLSYSGEDRKVAQRFSAALQRRFLRVFDYQDGKSIRPGQPWMDEIFNSLAESSIGIPLLSPGYVASPYCIKEARFMVDGATTGKMKILPILVEKGTRALPKWLSDYQYLDIDRVRDPNQLVAIVEKALDSQVSR